MRKVSPPRSLLALVLPLGVWALVCLVPARAAGQANINEGLETAVIYVDVNTGSDSKGNGSINNPYQTINKGATVAIANNEAGIGTQVNIQPGTYRETVAMSGSSANTSLPITFQAVTNGTVIIDGATVLTGWTEYSANHKIYQTAWSYNFPQCAQISGCPSAQGIVLQSEMLAVNGAVMTQVLSIAELRPGSFYVDQTGELIYLYPPSGTNVSTATIETATQPTLWSLYGESNIVLRGLVFQYAGSCVNSAALNIGGTGSNILLDTLTVQWNNGQGLSINNPILNFTVQNTVANHNGGGGFQEFQTLNGLWSNDTANFNNWRGAQGAYYACNVGGSHPYQAHADTIDGMTLAYNQTYGIHWDTDNANISVSNMVATNNLITDIFTEKNEGPISISDSHACNANTLMQGGGLAIRNSTDISFTNSTLANNPPSQIEVFGQPGGIEITNWQTGQTINLISNGVTNTGNVIEGSDSSQYVFQNIALGGSDWTTFTSNFVSGSNTWWNADNSAAAFEVPEPDNATFLDFPGWQGSLDQDWSSKFSAPGSDPAAACNAILPDMPDYWLYIDNTALTMNALGEATFNLTGTPLDFSGTLSLMVDGLQGISGINSSFSPATILLSKGVQGSSALTISATTTAAAATYPIEIVANSGNITRMVTAQVTVPTPGFRLSSLLVNFGNQQIKTTSASQTVTLTNHGKSSTAITSIVASPTAFAQTSTCGTNLGAGKSCTVTITFTPMVEEDYSGTLTFTDADPTSPQVVTLTGTGISPPTVTVLPATLKFRSTTVGSISATMTSTLTNTSTTTSLTISSMSLGGSDPQDFQASSLSTCQQSTVLLPLATCALVYTFNPNGAGSLTATLTINDNTQKGSEELNLTGTGLAVVPTATLLPASLSFGSITQGKTSQVHSSTLTDTSVLGVLDISSITITGANAGDFALSSSSSCPQSGSINPLATCLISVTFSPVALGARSATLTINDNTAHGSQTISLSGTGLAGTTTATLTPKALKFGSVSVGTTSSGQSSTLTDTSSVFTLVTTSMTLTGANPGDFQISPASTCPQSGDVNPLAECLVTVTFTPTATGSRSATLTAYDNTASGSQTVTLSGSGTNSLPTATLLPASLNFGTVTVGDASAAQSSTLTDTSATITLQITSMALSGAAAGDYEITRGSTCPQSGQLSPLATCLVTIRFRPTESGTRNATLTVNDNTSGGKQTVSLSGSGD